MFFNIIYCANFYPTKYVTKDFQFFILRKKIVSGITCRVYCRVLNEIIGSLLKAMYMEVDTTPISSLIICFLSRISNTTDPLANQQNNYLSII